MHEAVIIKTIRRKEILNKNDTNSKYNDKFFILKNMINGVVEKVLKSTENK